MPATHLELWKKELRLVPESVWDQAELETLVLADNKLSKVAAQIGRLKKLRMLDLGHNELTEVPEALADLENLTDFLYLHDNRLTILPGSLASLTRLTSLPESIARLSRLRELHLRNNRLTSVPESIGELRELRLLDLRANPLTDLPAVIAALPCLEKLDLRWVTTLRAPAWFADLEARGCLVYR
jgi:Leucine-rich repeat (LRR) protein